MFVLHKCGMLFFMVVILILNFVWPIKHGGRQGEGSDVLKESEGYGHKYSTLVNF